MRPTRARVRREASGVGGSRVSQAQPWSTRADSSGPVVLLVSVVAGTVVGSGVVVGTGVVGSLVVVGSVVGVVVVTEVVVEGRGSVVASVVVAEAAVVVEGPHR